ncbi:unnamed protein product [Ectocarpus sp. 12 AP-2014]
MRLSEPGHQAGNESALLSCPRCRELEICFTSSRNAADKSQALQLTAGSAFHISVQANAITHLCYFRITRDDEIFDSDDDYFTIFQDDDTQSEESSDSTILLWLAVPPFIGAIAMGLGAIFTFKAVFVWKYGGGTAIPHVPVAPQPTFDFTNQPQSQQESKTAELGLAPPTAHPRTPPSTYHPQSPPPAYRR